MPTIQGTGGTFQGQVSPPSTQTVRTDAEIKAANRAQLAANRAARANGTFTVPPAPIVGVTTPAVATPAITVNNINNAPPPVIDTSSILDAAVTSNTAAVGVAQNNANFINTTGAQNTANIIEAEKTATAALGDLAVATADFNTQSAQIRADVTNTVVDETALYNSQIEQSQKETRDYIQQNLDQQKIDLAKKNQALINQKEIETKVLQARATFESEMPGSGFGQASRAYVSNIVNATNSQLYAFEASLALDEANVRLKATEIINNANLNYVNTLKNNKVEMAKLRGEYQLAITDLAKAKTLGPKQVAAEKARLEASFLERKNTLETTLRTNMLNAQNQVTSEYNDLVNVQNARKTESLANFDRDVLDGRAWSYSGQQMAELSARTGFDIATLNNRKNAAVSLAIAQQITSLGVEASPTQILAWQNQALALAKSGIPPAAAISATMGQVTRFAKDTNQTRSLELARSSAISQNDTTRFITDSNRQAAIDRGEVTPVTTGTLPAVSSIVTAGPIGSKGGQCGVYLQTKYNINDYKKSDYTLSPFENKIKLMTDIGAVDTPEIGGLVAWDAAGTGSYGHIGRVVGYDGVNVLIEDSNYKGDEKVKVHQVPVATIISKEGKFSKAITTVDQVSTSTQLITKKEADRQLALLKLETAKQKGGQGDFVAALTPYADTNGNITDPNGKLVPLSSVTGKAAEDLYNATIKKQQETIGFNFDEISSVPSSSGSTQGTF